MFFLSVRAKKSSDLLHNVLFLYQNDQKNDVNARNCSVIAMTEKYAAYTVGHITFWISLSLSPKFGLRPKICQKVKSFSFELSNSLSFTF